MKLRLSGLVSDIRGRIGGTVFRNTAAGHVASAFPSSRRQRRLLQTTRTADFAGLVDRWRRLLTNAQRTAWTQFAQGLHIPSSAWAVHPRTGLQAFSSENLVRRRAGISILLNPPPTSKRLPAPFPVAYLWLSQGILVTPDGQLPGTGEWFVVTVSNPVSPSAYSPRTWERQWWTIVGPAAGNQWLPMNPPLQVGATFRISIRLVSNTGLHSLPWITYDVL
jgi:hypothetical protein